MKRTIGFIMTGLLVVLFAAFPAAAQDEAPPPVCSPEQKTQVEAFLDRANENMRTAYTETSALGLDPFNLPIVFYGHIYQSSNDLRDTLPDCIDAVLAGDRMALVQQISLVTFANLSLQFKIDLQSPLYEELQDLSMYGNYALNYFLIKDGEIRDTLPGQGAISTEWLPACSTAQMQHVDTLIELEAEYDALRPALQTYLSTGEINEADYVAILHMTATVYDILDDGQSECAELYRRANADAFMFGDTTVALTVAQIMPLVEASGDVEAMTPVQQYLNDRLTAYLTEEAAAA